jgi:ligand-binding sensor domain-containing protein
MIKTWLAFLLCIWAFSGPAQVYTNYSEKDGLPSNHVYKITQDIHGFIWIATDEGIVKFNGSEFKIFTTKDGLPTNDVWNLFPAQDGKIWYAAKSKSMGYILNDKVYNFPTENNEVMSPIYANFDGNELMANGSRNTYRFKVNKWRLIEVDSVYMHATPLLHKKYKLLAQHKEDQIMLVDSRNQIKIIDDSKGFFSSYSRGQKTDSLYFTMTDYSYNVLHLNSQTQHRFSFENELGIKRLELVRINLIGDQIQITGENVIGILNEDLSVKEKYVLPKFLASHNSFMDKENNIWAATFSNGIYKYNINELQIKKEFPNSKVNDIKKVNGSIYALINDKGFYVYDKEQGEFIKDLASPQFLYDIAYIKETDTKYYLGDHEIITLHKGKKLTFTFPFKNELARSVVYHKNLLYSHQTAGISALNPFSMDLADLYRQPGARCLTVFKEELVIGTSTGLKRLVHGEIEDLDGVHKEFAYPVNGITLINEDQLLLTTDGYGAYLTDLKNIHLLEKSEFLSCDHAFFENQELYLPTNAGIYQYQFIEDTFQLKHIWNTTNGLPTNKINGVEKLENVLLVGTNQGIIHLPLDYKTTSKLVNIYIEEATYKSKTVHSGASESYSGNNNLNFIVKTIDYRPNALLSYQFKLSPSQKEWTTTTSSNLTFSDLNPDQYQLQIKNGELMRCFDFTITSRWYQSWIFYLALALLLVVMVISSTKYLSRNAEKKRVEELLRSKKLSELQLKALRSQMNPHFVFNSLTAIQYYINENDFETSDKYLVKFSRLIREFFELSKEQLVSVEREIQLLSNYLALEQLRFKGKLNYIFEIDPELDRNDKLPSMLLQPIVENAVNHGIFHKETTGTVLLKFLRISNDEIQISIQDDGKGYQGNKEGDRLKSTSVLEDRLKFLRETGVWEITVERKEAFPEKEDKGHKVCFQLKRLTDEKI